MKKRAMSLIALAALTAVFYANAEPRIFPVAEVASQADVYPDRVTRFPNGVTGLADVTYSVIPGFRPLVLDLYQPTGDALEPLVLFVHGGGWVGGNTRHSGALENFPLALAELAAEGFVVASVEYRLSGEAPFPAALQDVRAALRYLKGNAEKYRIEPSKVAIWGGSAGGQLAALAAVSCGDQTLDAAPAQRRSECVQGAVVWYGVFDFAPVVAGGAGGSVGRYLDCESSCNAATVRRASPVSYLSSDDPPFLLIHGEQDQTVDIAQSRSFEAALRHEGVEVRSLYIPSVDHSFVGRTPEETRAATLAATNATFDFFHTLFDGAP
nr:dienelactone hydrolase [uncultured bacterium]